MDMNDKVFGFAYMMAFRDATMRNAFPRRDGESDKTLQDRKTEIKKHSNQIVHDYIDAIMSGQNTDSLDSPDPIETIFQLCDQENTDNGFTFGNAQKLVNMTAKYMFLSVYNDPKKRKNYVSCHCPMDSVMMDRIRENSEKYGLGNIKWKYSWSRLRIEDESVKEYERFQEYIRKIAEEEGILPIEEDFLLWDE